MKAVWWAHRAALGMALQRLLRQPFALILTMLMMAVAFALPALLWVLLSNGERVVAHLPVQPQLTLFLKADVSNAARQALQARLQAHGGVIIQYISKQKAWDDLLARGNLGDVGAALAGNPLPDALVLTLTDGTDPTSLLPLLANAPEIEDTIQDAAWVARLQAFAHAGRQLVWALSALLGVGVVVVTGNTVRLQILLQQAEIEVSQLIGATRGYIRRPFLYFAALQGLLGGMAACGLVAGLVHWLSPSVSKLAALYGTDIALTGMPFSEMAWVLLAAALLAWLGAWITVTRHLQVLARGNP